MRRSDYLALGAAGIVFALSVALRFGGARDEGLFVAVCAVDSEEGRQRVDPAGRCRVG